MSELVFSGQLLKEKTMDAAHKIKSADVVGRCRQNFSHQRLFSPDVRGTQFLGITFLQILGIVQLQSSFDVQNGGFVPFDQMGGVAVEKPEPVPKRCGCLSGNALFPSRVAEAITTAWAMSLSSPKRLDGMDG